VATAITPMAFYETVMVKGYATLVDSDTEVDVNTGIVAAGRLQSLIDSRDHSHDMWVMKVQLGQIYDAVKSTVPQEMWRAIVEMLEADGYFPGFPHRPQDYAHRLEIVREAASDAGRDPTSPVQAVMLTGRN
jgi:hypothetical protein